MERALYEPGMGYYSRPGRLVGRSGDFFTSVSVGSLFGRLLASYLAKTRGSEAGAWRILELGAHDGSLAHDVLAELAVSHPEAFSEVEYAIIEPQPALAARQRETLAEFSSVVTIVSQAEELDVRPGILIANELIDALPCRVVESTGDGWQEMGVSLGEGGGFEWQAIGPAGEVAEHLPVRPAGYRTEVRLELPEVLSPLAALLAGGRMLWIDYGFEADDYYAEGRSEGTLQTFIQHRTDNDPLGDPGSKDITAHVDFTALGKACESLGGRVIRFENQARFLTELARPLLLSLEGRTDDEVAKVVRQFQTLTHPGQLGSRFHVMEVDFSSRAT